MLLEWENNSGKFKTTAGNYKSSAANFKITLLKTANKFHWVMWLGNLHFPSFLQINSYQGHVDEDLLADIQEQ